MNITGADVANMNEARRPKRAGRAKRAWAWFWRRFVRILLRVGLFPASTRTNSDTMGDWKRLQQEKDDPRPGLVLPDPNAPHADLIRRVRLYAQNGAKALAPWLDAPRVPEDLSRDMALGERLQACLALAEDNEARSILRDLSPVHYGMWGIRWPEAMQDAHAAYNSPWTVIDGEVYEYESDTRKRVVQ